MFLQPSEAGKATHFMRESSGENHVTLFWGTGRLQGARREFTVPVDSSVQRTTFSLSTDTKGTLMTLLRPSGEAVVPGAAGVEITELNCGRVVTVATPEAGDWRAQVAGSGRFWLEAGSRAKSSWLVWNSSGWEAARVMKVTSAFRASRLAARPRPCR